MAESWILPGLELNDIAGQVLDTTVPRFADAAGFLVRERLLAGGDPGGATGAEFVVRRIGIKVADGAPVAAAAFPDGKIVVFAADSPYGRCLATGNAVTFTQLDGQTMERAGPGGREILAQYRAFLAVPMTADAMVAGVLIFARTPDSAPFSDDEVKQAATLAERAGSCVANACRLIRYQHAIDAFQEALLPADPVSPAVVEVAGCCLPADGLIGGDWYDVIPLPSGRVGLIVGDVMGHGIGAAATMSQLRAAARALAELGLPPAELLSRLDRVTATLRNPVYATCAYVIIDAAGGLATIALAGHLPPVLALPDGTTHVPDIPAGLSLGLSTAAFGEARVRLPSGAVLALFTDGLVETRTRPYDHGIRMLRSVLGREHGCLQRTCDTVVRAVGQRREDDLTLVLARIPEP